MKPVFCLKFSKKWSTFFAVPGTFNTVFDSYLAVVPGIRDRPC
eukprot:SAG31_NODE_43728_length_265_cov_49.391566_1_plen_42_part_10